MQSERRRVGRYRLLCRLGEGGMGEVHRARAYGAEGVVKELCVKLIRAERLVRSGAAARFVDEARVSMRLNHGNIVAVFDFGRCGDAYYLAMEWVDGSDLRSVLNDLARRGERLPPDVAAHVAAEVARALSYAHELTEPVVHCDVKPENVLVSAAGDVKLADFGLATVARASAGGVAGTPGYMAPEQRDGGSIGPPADLWALGVLLTELASGARDPVAIEHVELAAIARELSAEAPRDRPASASSVANRLESFVARARAEGSESPRERLAELARRARRDLDREGERDLVTTASFLRDGPDDGFLRNMSNLSTVPPPATPAVIAPPAPSRARRTFPAAALVGAIVVIAAGAYAAVETARAPAVASARPPTTQHDRPEAPSAPSRRAERIVPAPVEAAEVTEPSTFVPSAPRRESAPPRPRRSPRVAAAAPVEQAPARLSINAVPWSDVEIDGVRVGVTPIFDHALAPGAHRVRFTNAPLGASVERTIELSAGEARRLVVDLEEEPRPAAPASAIAD